MREEFDFDVALAALQDGQGRYRQGRYSDAVSQATDQSCITGCNWQAHLKADKSSIRRNGAGRKTIKSTSGSFGTGNATRSGWTSFEPQLVKNTRPT